jgi:predicted nucleic acid-binding Zn ribbon protein
MSMPLYDFKCPSGHTTTRVMSMSSITAGIHIQCDICGMDSHRSFAPTGNIIRPKGWDLKPGDKGYYDIPIERHPHIRDPKRGV